MSASVPTMPPTGPPALLPQGAPQGLLDPSAQSYGPPPMPPLPGLMRPVEQGPSINQIMLQLLPKRDTDTADDTDDHLPAALRPYAAGLRPSIKPSEVPWSQEIIYERLQVEDSEIQAVARYYFQQAQKYNQTLSGQREEASDYYRGEKFGDEEKGRSQLVMTVVRDTIRSTLPSLLRVFTGVDNPVSFSPISTDNPAGSDAQATALARQATDYCRWALFTANKGWQILHDALLDALTRKAGWVRWYWGKRQQIRTEVCEGLLLPQLQMLLADPGIQAQRIVRRPMTKAEQAAVAKTAEGMMWLQQGGAAELWEARITRSSQQGWPQVVAVPADCVWILSDANTIPDAHGVFHVREVTASELIEQGLPEGRVMAHADSMTAQRRREAMSRDPASGQNIPGSPPNDKSKRIVRYVEGWIRTDTDGDNIAELIHVHMLGDAAELIQWDRTDEIPLCCFTPYREPGRVIGYSQADMVMDLQKTESRVMRAVLDSLGQSMFPRTVVEVGHATLADVKQTAIGSIIRVSQQGAVQELTKPFMGKEALPVMEVLESIRESRTGITKASSGLTIDELQSTAPVAVSQQSSAAQDRLDMVARTLAETGLAPLYQGLLRMLARQQDRPNVILLRGQWIAIDPRALATDWEVEVNVGGRGTPMERMAMLSQIATKQEQIMQIGGMDNPLAGIPEYRNTLVRLLETANISDSSSYFKSLPPGWQPPPPPPPPPNTDMLLAQVQQQKTAADVENDRAKQQTDRANTLLDDDRERSQAALDNWVRAYVAHAQYGVPLPSVDEFMQAMGRKVPALNMLGDLPPQGAPITVPGGEAPGQPPQPTGPRPPMAGPQQPPGGRLAPPMMPPAGSSDPATAMAVRNALMGRGMPTPGGQMATRSALGSVGPLLARPTLNPTGVPPAPDLAG